MSGFTQRILNSKFVTIMKCKTFTTHTFTGLTEEVLAIELSFNVWASENKEIDIIRTDYFINKRRNKHGTEYEQLTLFVFYKKTR
jgi:hypothetical protein